MAATLAHELNQPIGTVANVLRGLRMRLQQPPTTADAQAQLLAGVQLALDQALFAARVIARIRDYTHVRQPRLQPLDLAQVARTAASLLDWELQRQQVALVLDFTPRACPVLADETMLQQVFVNLLRNALDALRDNPADHPPQLRLGLAIDRGQAVLSVHDNGCGLPKDAQDQLFVPFQSTKPNGMGIGLNICRSFVEQHQGRLWFSPPDTAQTTQTAAPARGTTFHVALPLRTAPERSFSA
jgi:signal transduction histidine kinase